MKYENEVIGFNSRLDEMQAAFLRVKLRKLDEWNDRRNIIAKQYCDNLNNVKGLTLPEVMDWAEPVWHLFVVRHQDRNRLQKQLNEASIATMIHYPIPPHLSGAYADHMWRPGDFPVAESIHHNVLSLPLWAQMTNDDVFAVIQACQNV